MDVFDLYAYVVDVEIEGVAPLLQHRFGAELMAQQMTGQRKVSGTPDYSEEWRSTCYTAEDGSLYEPASHLEGALIKSAVQFRIKGARGKTYKDLVRATCFVSPEHVPLNDERGRPLHPPDETVYRPDLPVYVDVRPVVVQRSRVVRSRLAVAAGWRLAFQVNVADEQLRPDVLQTILAHAGRFVGLGDYRPRFGRFRVVKFVDS